MQAYTRTITEPSLLADDLLDKLPNGFALRARSQWLQLANQHDDGYQDVNLVSRYPVADHWLKDITQHFENSSLPFDISASDSDIVAGVGFAVSAIEWQVSIEFRPCICDGGEVC